MGEGAKRNEPCWCGSGRKYKLCHLGRELLARPTIEEVHYSHRVARDIAFCLHPEAPVGCVMPVIKAHAVPSARALSGIATNGSVMGFAGGLGRFLKDGQARPRMVSISAASTFTGLCSRHDTVTFRRIDLDGLELDAESAFLLAYRPLLREFFLKIGNIRLSTIQQDLDRGLSKSKQRIAQERNQAFFLQSTLDFRDYWDSKEVYDAVLVNSAFDSVWFYAVEFATELPVVATSCVTPEIDFNGLLDGGMHSAEFESMMGFSLFPSKPGVGTLVFSGIDADRHVVQFVESLSTISDERLADAALRYAFEFTELTFWNKGWWDELPPESRESLIRRFNSNLAPGTLRDTKALLDTGERIVDWPVIRRWHSLPALKPAEDVLAT